LSQALQALSVGDFQELRTRLREAPTGEGWATPKDSLAEATSPQELLGCSREDRGANAALAVGLLLEEGKQGHLAGRLREEEEEEEEQRQQYREHLASQLCWCREAGAHRGETLVPSSRFTAPTITRQPGEEREAVSSPVSSGSITVQTLFQPLPDGQSPRVVVLVGAPGMGKTMAVRRVMLEWLEGSLQAQFDYVFCIDCRDPALPGAASVAQLAARCCPRGPALPGKMLARRQRTLFMLDGLEALGFAWAQPDAGLSSDPAEVKPLETTLLGLLKGTVAPSCSLLVTTRPTALRSLRRCLQGGCYAELRGFSVATREGYVHQHFQSHREAGVALGYIRGNGILHSLSSIPVVSRAACALLEQELCRGRDLAECSGATATATVLFYLSWLLRGRDAPGELRGFLLRLCPLAAEGIWKHQVLFEEKEIQDRGLDRPGLLPLFLNEEISARSGESGVVYSFTHLHLQEFFAALFYLLEDEEEPAGGSGGALRRDPTLLLRSYSESRADLSTTVRFLFGLMSRGATELVATTLGCRAAPGAREELLRWLRERHRGSLCQQRVSELETLHLLFETGDTGFVQRALAPFALLELRDAELTPYDQRALSFCLRHWAGLSALTLRGCSFHPRGQLPGAGASGAAGHRQEELPCPMRPLCQALRHPGSALRVLRLQWCQLSESCCEELAELLAQQPSLTQLELSDGRVGDGGVRLLCQGLQQPGCHLRVLR
ncbi:NLRP3 protein, partial [Upupa epops]|nr:NLRP3 protein [Upupa epops]